MFSLFELDCYNKIEKFENCTLKCTKKNLESHNVKIKLLVIKYCKWLYQMRKIKLLNIKKVSNYTVPLIFSYFSNLFRIAYRNGRQSYKTQQKLITSLD